MTDPARPARFTARASPGGGWGVWDAAADGWVGRRRFLDEQAAEIHARLRGFVRPEPAADAVPQAEGG